MGRLNHVALAYQETVGPAKFFKDILQMKVSEKKVLGLFKNASDKNY